MALTHSSEIDKIAASLAKAQRDIKTAVKDATNPHFESTYADLKSVWGACREALTTNEIAVVQGPSTAEGSCVDIDTMLIHSSGQWFRDQLRLKAKDAFPQSLGSAITYGRRYALASMCGVAPEDDDDGAGAEGGKRTRFGRRETRSSEPHPENGYINAKQQQQLLAAAKSAGWKPEELSAWVKKTYAGWSRIPADHFDRVLLQMQTGVTGDGREVM